MYRAHRILVGGLIGGILIFNGDLQGFQYETIDGGKTYSAADVPTELGEQINTNGNEYLLIKSLLDTPNERMAFGDADHDGNLEVYFGDFPNDQIAVWEINEDLSITVTSLPFYGVPWAVGDLDGDGNTDLIVQDGDGGNGFLRVYESPDPNSLPTELRYTVTLPGIKVNYYAQIVETDGDGKNEILMSANSFTGGEVRIYEWDGGLNLIWTSPNPNGTIRTKAVADFDGNGKTDIAVVSVGGRKVYVYENVSDNNYQALDDFDIPSVENVGTDVAPAVNFDGGLPELTVGSCVKQIGSLWAWTWYIYEWDQGGFSLLSTFEFADKPFFGRVVHAAADYDGDGRDELVVSDIPTVRIIEYEGGQMIETWNRDEVTTPGRLYTFDVRVDDTPNFGYVMIRGSLPDTLQIWEAEWVTQAPAQPVNFAINPDPNNNPKLTWDKNTEPDLKDYRIKRKNSWIATVSGSMEDPVYVDTDVVMSGGSNITYKVYARDNDLQLSSPATKTIVGKFQGFKITGLGYTPRTLNLLQNTPNPFNPVTRISYSLPEVIMVRLAVYDIQGRKVKDLVDQQQEAGFYSLFWDGTGLYGQKVASGVYIYKIIAGDNVLSRKMVLMR